MLSHKLFCGQSLVLNFTLELFLLLFIRLQSTSIKKRAKNTALKNERRPPPMTDSGGLDLYPVALESVLTLVHFAELTR